MNNVRRRYWILVFILVVLAQIACGTVTSAIGRFECDVKGGTWRQEVRSDGEVEEWCESTPTQASATQAVTTQEIKTEKPTPTKKSNDNSQPPVVDGMEVLCMPPEDDYSWSYEDFKTSSGTGGTTCNARFVFKSLSNEPLVLIVHTAMDNNEVQESGWNTYNLPAKGEWEEKVNQTNYKDGVVTYFKVDRLLVTRDAAECMFIIFNDNQAIWDQKAYYVDEFTCK